MITGWPSAIQSYPLKQITGGPVDNLASFVTDVGPPISRPRSTALVEAWDMAVVFQTRAHAAIFEAWWRDDLAFGSSPFIWRHPRTKAVGKWRIPQQFKWAGLGGEITQVSFAAMALPGSVWFAAYVPEETARVPYFVADYASGIYGVDAVKGVASGLAAVAGTYEVWTYLSTGTVTIGLITYAGTVPQTAPSGVTKIVGFLP